MKKGKEVLVYVLIAAILLFAAALYYNGLMMDKSERGVDFEKGFKSLSSTNGVLDSVCGGLDLEIRDECCQRVYSDYEGNLVQCVGNWKFVENSEVCEFVCEES